MNTNWFAAHIILWVKYTEHEQKTFPLWENVVLIKAQSQKEALTKAFQGEKAAFESDGWKAFRSRVSDKFKEEVSDVFSCLSAVLIKLDPERDAIEKQRSRFVNESGGVEYLKCPWCGNRRCTDECLVTHGISSEIIEKITKF